MGATTVWERWNSLMPDGTPNPDGMNSYNHYAYGSVMEFVYRRIAGIEQTEAGFKKVKIAPDFPRWYRTSDGEGVVENYTLDRLRQFKLDLHEPLEPIPSLDDILEEMKGTDVVLLFEIKSEKTEIVNALKTAVEAHRMQKQIVVITYHAKILEAMARYLPEIPTADLSSVLEDEMEDAILKFRYFNTATSASFHGVTPHMNAMMRDRGIVGWFWTYDSVSDMIRAMLQGFTGLTTNVADEFVSGNSTKYVYLRGDESVKTVPVVGGEIPLIGVRYNGEEEKVGGKVIYAEDLGERYGVVASFFVGEETNLPAIFTQTYYINK